MSKNKKSTMVATASVCTFPRFAGEEMVDLVAGKDKPQDSGVIVVRFDPDHVDLMDEALKRHNAQFAVKETVEEAVMRLAADWHRTR